MAKTANRKAKTEAKPKLILDYNKIILEAYLLSKRENAHQIAHAVADANGPTFPTVYHGLHGNKNSTLATISSILFDGLGLIPEEILDRPLGDFFTISTLDSENGKKMTLSELLEQRQDDNPEPVLETTDTP